MCAPKEKVEQEPCILKTLNKINEKVWGVFFEEMEFIPFLTNMILENVISSFLTPSVSLYQICENPLRNIRHMVFRTIWPMNGRMKGKPNNIMPLAMAVTDVEA